MLKGYKYNIFNQDIYIIEKNKMIYAITNQNIYEYEQEETLLIKEAFKQLKEYEVGTRQEFDLPLYLHGTDFQIQVWKALLKIPYGKTKTYKEIAQEINNPKASRAVGNANNKNKIMIVVPCHRVIGSNGKLVGYAGGLEMKEQLLKIEDIK